MQLTPPSRVDRYTGDLTPEHRDLMTQHHDLGVLGRLAEQHQQAKDPDRDQVEQTKSHEPRS